jgi:hypothetical protein
MTQVKTDCTTTRQRQLHVQPRNYVQLQVIRARKQTIFENASVSLIEIAFLHLARAARLLPVSIHIKDDGSCGLIHFCVEVLLGYFHNHWSTCINSRFQAGRRARRQHTSRAGRFSGEQPAATKHSITKSRRNYQSRE